MSLIIAKELMCDGCGEWLRIDSNRLTDAWPTLSKEGWTRVRPQLHYCPNCSAVKKSWEEGDAG